MPEIKNLNHEEHEEKENSSSQKKEIFVISQLSLAIGEKKTNDQRRMANG